LLVSQNSGAPTDRRKGDVADGGSSKSDGKGTNSGDAMEATSDDLDEDDAGSSFVGLPWHDEKGPDGKEYRLSQMLADEEWEVLEADPDDTAPMTLEEYKEEVEKIMVQAEEELRETEAILLSKPGNDPLGWDYDDELLSPMSNTTETEDGEEQVDDEDFLDDADLEALEMDEDEDNEINDDFDPQALDVNSETEVVAIDGSPTLHKDGGDSDVSSTNQPFLDIKESNISTDDGGSHENGSSATDSSSTTDSVVSQVDLPQDSGDGDGDVIDNDSSNDEEEVKGSDMIQPIFLDGEDHEECSKPTDESDSR
jgi:hypothetical protein